jgi:cobyrinic acid a,c-diamide synthase
MKGVVIAGTHSGCGKTTVTMGILTALKKKGYKVQSFKAGPDFIDSGIHRLVTIRPSRNLDLWMCGENYVVKCFRKYSTGVDMAVVEGVMGLYDGELNTAKLADLLNLPVILVVDTYGMAESAGAVVKGFYENAKCKMQNAKLMGVIFNRVASENHYKRLKNSVQGVPVLGYLPRNLAFEIPHRHLGLIIAEENPITKENIDKLADAVLKHIDVDVIVQKSKVRRQKAEVQSPQSKICNLNSKIRIAVARDKAFCFYYEDNLDLLKDAGGEIVTFSPLSDNKIPENVNALYIGGGYPELYANELSEKEPMLKAIYRWALSGKPIYAECGGLMYLSKGIYNLEGKFLKMAGIFPFATQIPPYPPLLKGNKGGLRPHLGYREIELKDDCILGKKGDRFRGHEFHYSEIKGRTQTKNNLHKIYLIKTNNGQTIQNEGYRIKNTLASYVHIHFGSNPQVANTFVEFSREA